jgi:hypothetical protein
VKFDVDVIQTNLKEGHRFRVRCRCETCVSTCSNLDVRKLCSPDEKILSLIHGEGQAFSEQWMGSTVKDKKAPSEFLLLTFV